MERFCKCGATIGTSVIINGKLYSLKNRTNCLGCVPFKSRMKENGKLYSKWDESRKQRHRAVVASKGLRRKKELVELAGGKCIICGYNKCLRALTFHHRDPNNKKFQLSSADIKSKKWEEVIEEFKKCDLLCVRCHAEIHDLEYQNYINIEVYKSPNKYKKTFFCPNCNSNMSSKSKMCIKCKQLKSRKVNRPDKDVLINQINELGYSAVGRLYGVSDNAIRKWIKNY